VHVFGHVLDGIIIIIIMMMMIIIIYQTQIELLLSFSASAGAGFTAHVLQAQAGEVKIPQPLIS
jgi:hypothetical protein